MLHRIYFHLVWTTRDRVPLIEGERAALIERLLPRLAAEERGKVLGIGLVSTHLHLLLRVNPTFNSGHFVQRAKSISALRARRDELGDVDRPLRWAKGYSITSVGPRGVPRALGYVLAQPQHHPSEAIVRVQVPRTVEDADMDYGEVG